MTPQEFIAKWGPGGPAYPLNEEQGAQSHFLDLCELLGVPKPGSEPDYLFEEKGAVIGGRTGYADVFKRGHFAWENKAPGKNLDAALKQLLSYSLALDNPPLLVVCDRLTVRIHTQFNGHPSETHQIALAQMAQPERLALLRRLWTDPGSFRPQRTTRDITETAARSFANLAEQLRQRGHDPEQVAHFLTQCLFCFFAEDVGLLPGRMFERLVTNKHITSDKLTDGLGSLFTVMRDGGLYGPDDIPWFNGGLFKRIDVPRLQVMDVTELRNAAALNWSAIDVSIFGTLFERGLDPAKRSQLGAHYTDPATIMRIVTPVVQRPLLQQWADVTGEIGALMGKSKKRGDKSHREAQAAFIRWLHRLEAYRILDPACGSGNFLYLGLKTLKDIEHKSHLEAATLGLDRQQDLVTGPHNMLGIELNEYAAELARVTVWIGELQWRIEHGYDFKTNPVLEPLDHIECRDALLTREPGRTEPVKAQWPQASVVIGNPPFLGNKKMKEELGVDYAHGLRGTYSSSVPASADFVCYWFDKALKAICRDGLGAAGLVATQAIRRNANRTVLDAATRDSRIFEAWNDEPWINEGAAVRVSMICFGSASQPAILNGVHVPGITADLNVDNGTNLTTAHALSENAGKAFQGTSKVGAFEIPGQLARSWLQSPNPHGMSNSGVLRPWANGQTLANRPADDWIIDFGTDMDEGTAALYEQPFQYLVRYVKTERLQNNREAYRRYWWRHAEPRSGLRAAAKGLDRVIATPRVAKHRLFVWMDRSVLPDTRLYVITRDDDFGFGVLSSRMHGVWALANASIHGDGDDGGRPTYNAKSCFETFPFPLAGAANSRTSVGQVAGAAKRLNDLREAWLNPPEWTERVPEVVPLGMDRSPYPDRIVPRPGHEKDVAKRTLTNLYNQRPAWLVAAHQALDMAVAAAYGWADYTPAMPDEEILKRLLALNLERARQSPAPIKLTTSRKPGKALTPPAHQPSADPADGTRISEAPPQP